MLLLIVTPPVSTSKPKLNEENVRRGNCYNLPPVPEISTGLEEAKRIPDPAVKANDDVMEIPIVLATNPMYGIIVVVVDPVDG